MQILHIRSPRAKNLRITIKNNGIVRVTRPFWCSQKKAEKFVEQKKQWILDNAKKQKTDLTSIDIQNRNKYITLSKPQPWTRTRSRKIDLTVTLATHVQLDDRIQHYGNKFCIAYKATQKLKFTICLPARLSIFPPRGGTSGGGHLWRGAHAMSQPSKVGSQ